MVLIRLILAVERGGVVGKRILGAVVGLRLLELRDGLRIVEWRRMRDRRRLELLAIVGAVCFCAVTTIRAAVEVVLDSVVTAVVKTTSNLSPLGTHFMVKLEDKTTFLVTDGGLVQARVEVLVVALATLLSGTSLHAVGDGHPVGRTALFCDVGNEALVLLDGPWTPSVRGHFEW